MFPTLLFRGNCPFHVKGFENQYAEDADQNPFAVSSGHGPTQRLLLVGLGMSAFGPKQTWASALHMSAFRGKADLGP